MKNLSTQPNSTMRRYLLEALIALELLMSFSFLGYFHIEPISVTIAYVPVLVAGAVGGVPEAMAVGAVFGLASMWKASASYVMDTDKLFSPLSSGSPLGSLALSVGARVLFGLAVGLLYAAARRSRRPGLWIGLTSFFGRTVHSLLVYSAMGLFFPEAGYGPANAFSGLLGAANIVVNLATAGLVLLLWRLTRSNTWQKFQRRLELSRILQAGERYHRLYLALVTVVTLLSSFAITFYFVHRMNYVLGRNGVYLTDTSYSDLLHLQVQFLFGILSMMLLVILFLILTNFYQNYEGKWDALTGVMTRRAFFSACGQIQRTLGRGDECLGYFIMVDLDFFKEINDHLGHPAGDRALKEVARSMKEIFGRRSLVGRMGGDEFAAMIYSDITREELEVALRHFLERTHRIELGGQPLTCSVGALPVRLSCPPEELYREADQLLYTAKERGRNQYVIAPLKPEEDSLPT